MIRVMLYLDLWSFCFSKPAWNIWKVHGSANSAEAYGEFEHILLVMQISAIVQ